MGVVKKTISINEKIAREANALNPNFSAVVEAALSDYLRRYHIQKAMSSFGQWAERENESADIVSKLRELDDRECITGSDIKNKSNIK